MEKDASYQFPEKDVWFADPLEIESYDATKVVDVNKIEVKYRKGCDEVINFKGTVYSIAPHFYIPLAISLKRQYKKDQEIKMQNPLWNQYVDVHHRIAVLESLKSSPGLPKSDIDTISKALDQALKLKKTIEEYPTEMASVDVKKLVDEVMADLDSIKKDKDIHLDIRKNYL
jgi:hypothetical protein